MLRKLSALTLCYASFLGCASDGLPDPEGETPIRPGEVSLSPDELTSLIKERHMERTSGVASQDITGHVWDTGGVPLQGVTVSAFGLNGKTAVTDKLGYFEIKDVPYGQYLFNFEHLNYALVQRSMVIAHGRNAYIATHMLKKEPEQMIDIDQGGEVRVGPLTLRFDPGDLVFESSGGDATNHPDDAEVVRGEVKISIAVFDPRTPGHILASPAPLEGIDATGNVVGLESFGMIGVELEQNGRPVNVHPNQTVTAKMHIDGIYGDVDVGAQIPMWHMDEQRGIWVQEGASSVVLRESEQLVAVAELPHFSFWNYDRNNRSYCASVKVPNAKGIRTVSTHVNSNQADGLWTIQGVCNASGGCVTNVPSRFGDYSEVHFKLQVDVSGSGNWCDLVVSYANQDRVRITGYEVYNMALAMNPNPPDYTWCGTPPTNWGASASGLLSVTDALSYWMTHRPFTIVPAVRRVDEDSCTGASSGGRVDVSAINDVLFHPSDNGFQRMASNAAGAYSADIDRDGFTNTQDTCPSASNNGSCSDYCYVPPGSDPNGFYDYDQDTIDDFCDSNWNVYNRSQYNGL